ncbi:FG-GAP-like repeat-containing protein [Rhodobiaceae bacterium]|nr:FG-GAP-like repeat-containing protein [Rhodobiaceae bacterium]
MADYYGTDDDDLIDASQLPEDFNKASDKIYPGKGNDEIINIDGHEVVSSEGNDSYSGINIKLAFFFDPDAVTINLLDGIANDGYGGTDAITGKVSEVYLSSEGGNFTGTENFEKVIIWGSSNTIITSGGNDRIELRDDASSDYTIKKVGDDIHLDHKILDIKNIINGKAFVVWNESAELDIIDTGHYYHSGLASTLTKTIYSFKDDTFHEGFLYSGNQVAPGIIDWNIEKPFLFDINSDGKEDAIFPMWKGYASGVNTQTPFIALTVQNNTLIYDEDINLKMPIDAGAGRTAPINLVATDSLAWVAVNIYTDEESRRGNEDWDRVPPSELTLVQKIGSEVDPLTIFPTPLQNAPDTYPLAVFAHSMDTGDINGDGLDDILVGNNRFGGAYELLQKSDGTFESKKQSIYEKMFEWPLENDYGTGEVNMLNDAMLIDFNNDGFDDLYAGFKGSAKSFIIINDNGKFTEDNKIFIPTSVYGVDDQVPLVTYPADFDHDGDMDIALNISRAEPYYGGYYIQILLNDGEGNLSDVTNLIPENSLQDAYGSRQDWVKSFQLIDVNNDNHIDIAGSRSSGSISEGEPIFYLNDGEGKFTISQVYPNVPYKGEATLFADFDEDNLIEYITFYDSKNNDKTESTVGFYLYEMTAEIGTGPNYSTDTAEQGAPGFNETYYLDKNTSAQEALTAGTYATGLEHYLAEGKDAELKTFAPFTKVHGYSGNDTIVLREGDETAYGYAGKDTIEGGAGNDIINGGIGVDTAIYKDSSSAYTLTTNEDGTFSVIHTSPSEGFTDEGSDILTSIEKMQFSDQALSKTSLKYQLSKTIDASENSLSAHTEDVLSGTLNFNKGDNIIILDGQGKTYRGLEGDDTYFISQLLPKSGKVSITDTEGSNLVQLPANTYIDKSLFTKNAARLTLEDGREVTISGADKFSYNVGGNITNGTKGTDLTFTEFAEVFGVYDILNSSGAQTGEISDMYII